MLAKIFVAIELLSLKTYNIYMVINAIQVWEEILVLQKEEAGFTLSKFNM